MISATTMITAINAAVAVAAVVAAMMNVMTVMISTKPMHQMMRPVRRIAVIRTITKMTTTTKHSVNAAVAANVVDAVVHAVRNLKTRRVSNRLPMMHRQLPFVGIVITARRKARSRIGLLMPTAKVRMPTASIRKVSVSAVSAAQPPRPRHGRAANVVIAMTIAATGGIAMTGVM